VEDAVFVHFKANGKGLAALDIDFVEGLGNKNGEDALAVVVDFDGKKASGSGAFDEVANGASDAVSVAAEAVGIFKIKSGVEERGGAVRILRIAKKEEATGDGGDGEEETGDDPKGLDFCAGAARHGEKIEGK